MRSPAAGHRAREGLAERLDGVAIGGGALEVARERYVVLERRITAVARVTTSIFGLPVRLNSTAYTGSTCDPRLQE